MTSRIVLTFQLQHSGYAALHWSSYLSPKLNRAKYQTGADLLKRQRDISDLAATVYDSIVALSDSGEMEKPEYLKLTDEDLSERGGGGREGRPLDSRSARRVQHVRLASVLTLRRASRSAS